MCLDISTIHLYLGFARDQNSSPIIQCIHQCAYPICTTRTDEIRLDFAPFIVENTTYGLDTQAQRRYVFCTSNIREGLLLYALSTTLQYQRQTFAIYIRASSWGGSLRGTRQSHFSLASIDE